MNLFGRLFYDWLFYDNSFEYIVPIKSKNIISISDILADGSLFMGGSKDIRFTRVSVIMKNFIGKIWK